MTCMGHATGVGKTIYWSKSGRRRHGCPWEYNIKKCTSKNSLSFFVYGTQLGM